MITARAFFVLFGLFAVTSCGTRSNDVPHDGGVPSPIGTGMRIKDVSNPHLPNHPKNMSNVVVTGASVTLTDNFDETNNGKSRGNIFVQDVDSQEPYSGMTVFSPTFIPGDLRVAPGDVLDLSGQYQEIASLGTAVFPVGDGGLFSAEVLLEIAKPVATFRFEYKAPTPRVIDAADLDTYQIGRKWMGMLVTIKDVTLAADLVDSACAKGASNTGRQQAYLTAAGASARSGGQVVNELYQVKADDCSGGSFAKGTHFSSITGIVTYFFNLHIAPRSADDFVK